MGHLTRPLIASIQKRQEAGVLGIGLLLREFGRAQEVSPDLEERAPDCPDFLVNSSRGVKDLDDIHELLVQALKRCEATHEEKKRKADQAPEGSSR